MALLACKPVAQIYIGINIKKLEQLGIDVYQALYFAQIELSKTLNNYQVCAYVCANHTEEQIHIFNAYLNYEVVAYEDKKIIYPKLVEKIHGAIHDILETLQSNNHSLPSKESSEDKSIESIKKADSLHRALNKVNELNRTKPTGFSFTLSHGEKLEIAAKNFKAETLLITNANVNLSVVKNIILILNSINQLAFDAGMNYAKEEKTFTLSEFETVIMPDMPEDLFTQDSAVVEVIEESLTEIKDIDTENEVKDHKEMLWSAFIRSFKNGFISQAKKELMK